MALGRAGTFVEGEVLTAVKLEAEFDNILVNGSDLAWPATENKDFDGRALILSPDANTSMKASTNSLVEFVFPSGKTLLTVDGRTTDSVNGFGLVAGAAGSQSAFITRGDDTNIDLDLQPQGTGIVAQDSVSLMSHTQQILCGQTFGG